MERLKRGAIPEKRKVKKLKQIELILLLQKVANPFVEGTGNREARPSMELKIKERY